MSQSVSQSANQPARMMVSSSVKLPIDMQDQVGYDTGANQYDSLALSWLDCSHVLY